MKSTQYFFLILFFNSVFTISSRAQYSETIQSDRPGISIGLSTVGKNVFQIQTGPIFGNIKFEEDGETNILAESTVIRFGLTRNVEVSTAFTLSRDKIKSANGETTLSGLSQADVGFRVNLYEGGGLVPAVGFQSRLKLNILSKAFNPDHLGIECLLVTSQELTSYLSLTTNWGAIWNGRSADPRGVYTINLSFPIGDKLGGFVENFGSVKSNDFNTSFDAGVAYLVNNDLQLDISGGYGKNDGISDYFVDFGLSWRFFVSKNIP